MKPQFVFTVSGKWRKETVHIATVQEGIITYVLCHGRSRNPTVLYLRPGMAPTCKHCLLLFHEDFQYRNPVAEVQPIRADAMRLYGVYKGEKKHTFHALVILNTGDVKVACGITRAHMEVEESAKINCKNCLRIMEGTLDPNSHRLWIDQNAAQYPILRGNNE